MNRPAHYLKHHACYYRPNCLRCYLRAFFEIMVLFVSYREEES